MDETAYSKVSEFIIAACKDEVLLENLGITLEINKIERDYQKPNEPNIFRKEYDDYGLVREYEINPAYLEKVPMPRMEFSHTEHDEILAKLEENTNLDSLTVMLHWSDLEKNLQDRLGDELFNKIPALLKTIDEDGFVVGYIINEEAMKDLSRFDIQLLHYINGI